MMELSIILETSMKINPYLLALPYSLFYHKIRDLLATSNSITRYWPCRKGTTCKHSIGKLSEARVWTTQRRDNVCFRNSNHKSRIKRGLLFCKSELTRRTQNDIQ